MSAEGTVQHKDPDPAAWPTRMAMAAVIWPELVLPRIPSVPKILRAIIRQNSPRKLPKSFARANGHLSRGDCVVIPLFDGTGSIRR